MTLMVCQLRAATAAATLSLPTRAFTIQFLFNCTHASKETNMPDAECCLLYNWWLCEVLSSACCTTGG
jgi:hypothetical protein